MNEIIVQKFGGSSLASISSIKMCAEIVKRSLSDYSKIIVVVSAMGRLTDDLVDYLNNFKCPPEESDVVLSSGEQIAAGLFAAALNDIGVKSCSMMNWQVPIFTTSDHSSAKIKKIYQQNILDRLNSGYVVVIPGFQGITDKGKITTLGRGGSDITAVAIASEFNASLCEIYTDVDGVMRIDPDEFPNQSCLAKIGYQQLLEMSLGADVLHTRAIDIAYKNNIPIKVKSSYNSDEPGTEIKRDIEDLFIAGIVHKSNKALLIASSLDVLNILKNQPELIVHDANQTKILIDADDCKEDIEVIEVVRDLAVLNVVGSSGINDRNIIKSLLNNLKGVKLEAFTTTAIRIAIVVHQDLIQHVVNAALKTLEKHV